MHITPKIELGAPFLEGAFVLSEDHFDQNDQCIEENQRACGGVEVYVGLFARGIRGMKAAGGCTPSTFHICHSSE